MENVKRFLSKGFKLVADPLFLRHFHGWSTIFWVVMVVPTILTGLKTSVIYLVFLSVYAVIMGHWSSWQASRTEVAVLESTTETEITHEEDATKIESESVTTAAIVSDKY